MEKSRSYILAYETDSGAEDVVEYQAYGRSQAERYAEIFCRERGAHVLYVEEGIAVLSSCMEGREAI